MNPQLIKRMAKEAGMVEGPYANGSTERIWQENRDFPDALEMFASLIAKECVSVIQQRHKLALEHEWDVEDTLNDIKEHITEKFHCEKDY